MESKENLILEKLNSLMERIDRLEKKQEADNELVDELMDLSEKELNEIIGGAAGSSTNPILRTKTVLKNSRYLDINASDIYLKRIISCDIAEKIENVKGLSIDFIPGPNRCRVIWGTNLGATSSSYKILGNVTLLIKGVGAGNTVTYVKYVITIKNL